MTKKTKTGWCSKEVVFVAKDSDEIDFLVLAMAKKFVKETVVGLGAVMRKPCQVKTVEESEGIHKIILEWTGDDGTKKTRNVFVKDGTEIKEWESKHPYKVENIAIKDDCLIRCIEDNQDEVFDETKWNVLGGGGGGGDIKGFTAEQKEQLKQLLD